MACGIPAEKLWMKNLGPAQRTRELLGRFDQQDNNLTGRYAGAVRPEYGRHALWKIHHRKRGSR